MMAPLPQLASTATVPNESERPTARLDVRIGSARTTNYPLTRGELLIGGADGCDIRLAGSHLPAVICQFLQDASGVFLRRLVPAFPILHNSAPFNGMIPVPLHSGDRITVGSAEITLEYTAAIPLRPTFVAINPSAKQNGKSKAVERDDLAAERAELREQVEELEADRVAWYRRRQELEAEYRQMQDRLKAGQQSSGRDQDVSRRETAVQQQETELERVRAELTSIREGLFHQFQERREQLEQHQAHLGTATSAFQEHQRRAEIDLVAKQQQLTQSATLQQIAIDEEVRRQVSERELELQRRRLELERQFEAKLAEWQSEADTRRVQFMGDLQRLEPRMAETDSQRDALAAGFRELDNQRVALDVQRGELARERRAHEAERLWNEERRKEFESHQRERETIVHEREQKIDEDRDALDAAQQRHAGDLLRLDRWQADLESSQNELNARTETIETRHEQLLRDVAELEEQLTLAAVEQDDSKREAERQLRQKDELDDRAAQLAQRAGEVESHQATLAVLRSRLDRQQAEHERDATTLQTDQRRLEAAWAEVKAHLLEAEQVRGSLSSAQELTTEQHKQFAEQQALMEANRVEVAAQKVELATLEVRLKADRQSLDARSADMAEQTAILKAKTAQVVDLQERLEADRRTVREREGTLTDVDSARGQFQEQLRRRSDDLSQRVKQLDETALQLAADRQALHAFHSELQVKQAEIERNWHITSTTFHERDEALLQKASTITERERALERQISRLREVGQSVAGGRKELHAARQKWETERASALEEALTKWKEIAAFRDKASTEAEGLLKQAPELEDRAKGLFDKLLAARDVLRGQLNELHGYSKQSRETLDGLRLQVRQDAEQLRGREQSLDVARGEHRLAVAEFRQQLHDWQARVDELKTAMRHSETRIDLKHAELEAASKKTDATALDLARRMEELRLEQDEVSERRVQVEQHLSDMREWYRRKLRDLANARREAPKTLAPPQGFGGTHELDPGDRHLGELLRSLELVDAETLQTLWNSARQQNRTLRQVLLASGAVTLYQLALIEAGNLDALMIGRFRVIERLRISPREACYRVFDPTRGICQLRILGDGEMHDAFHPDEYRMRFAATMEAHHPHLLGTLEVLELNGRPAIVQEWVPGLPSSEWPSAIAQPGLWLKLVTDAVGAIVAAHAAGLTHGRLSSESFQLTDVGAVKLLGFGEPPWLPSGLASSFEPTPEADLRAFGQVAFLWANTVGETKRKGRAKGLPDSLMAILRRLETDTENPMSDTVSGAAPYHSAGELLADLQKLAAKFPLAPESWQELLAHLADRKPVAKPLAA